MIGNIYIKGQIGNNYDNEGKVTLKGVTLLDVLEQFKNEQANGATSFHFHINSPGGYVSVGNDIIEFISNVENAFTVGAVQVASIATKMFCAVPVENRMIQEGTEFMIHNPWIDGVSGDATELRLAADAVEKDEIELENFYSKATGLDKSTLSNLMKNETYLDADQCVKFGFASSVLKKERTQVLALNYNKTQIEMDKEQKTVADKILAALNLQKIEKPVERKSLALDTATDAGVLVSEFETLEVGDLVTIDGEPAPTGNYNSETLGLIEVVDGVVMAITPVEEPETMDSLKAKIEELEASSIEKDSAISALETEKEESKERAEEVIAQLKNIKAMKSEHEPTPRVEAFSKDKDKKEPVKRKSYAEAKAQANENRKK
jgi:ATP-dependent Clp protease, protease subunit